MQRRFSTKPQLDYIFFTDRDLGHIVPNALRQAGFKVERHADHFATDSVDADWLSEVGNRDWVALTHNWRQRYVASERDAVMRSRLALFLLIGHASHDELAANLVRTMPRVLRFLAKTDPPFIAKIYRPNTIANPDPDPGSVKMVLSLEEWIAGQP